MQTKRQKETKSVWKTTWSVFLIERRPRGGHTRGEKTQGIRPPILNFCSLSVLFGAEECSL